MKKGDKYIRISGLGHYYGVKEILKDISFSLSPNEFLTIIGPTACGKTTLLKIVSGLIAPTYGEATIRGEKIDPRKQNISFVFQEYSILPWKTVYENVAFGLELRGFSGPELTSKVEGMLELVDLKDAAHQLSHQISGGMKQRVAIARAYATDPDLLMMDEPFGQLDAQTRYRMEVELSNIWEKENKTVIFVTNNIEEAVFLADRVIVLSDIPTTTKGEYTVTLTRPREHTSFEFAKARREVTDIFES